MRLRDDPLRLARRCGQQIFIFPRCRDPSAASAAPIWYLLRPAHLDPVGQPLVYARTGRDLRRKQVRLVGHLHLGTGPRSGVVVTTR